MKLTRIIVALSISASALAALPASAVEGVPAVCGSKAPVLADGEGFVEHTLYLHGASPVGNIDQAQAFGGMSISDKKVMDATAPTSANSKIDLLAAITNPEFNGNPNMAYWQTTFENTTDFVCAGATFFSASQGGVGGRMFLDQGWGSVEPAAKATSTATGSDNVKKYTMSFPSGPYSADNVVLQLAPATGGAVYYDSTVHPSTFTYVTVEQVAP